MPLNKPALETGIVQLLTDMYEDSPTMTAAEARQIFAQRLADLINAFVKTGLVSVNVVTTGTATNHTGTGTGSIS